MTVAAGKQGETGCREGKERGTVTEIGKEWPRRKRWYKKGIELMVTERRREEKKDKRTDRDGDRLRDRRTERVNERQKISKHKGDRELNYNI